jgi:integrase
MSVYQDKTNKRKWYAEVPTGTFTTTGKPAMTRRTAPTKAEALRIERELKTQRDQGLPLPKADLTVAHYLAIWIQHVNEGTLADSTKISYEQNVRDYLIPHLGKHKLKDLHQRHIETMLKNLSTKRQPNTLRIIKQTLSAALTHAMRNVLIIRNVATLVNPIAVPKRRELRIQPEQIPIFLGAIENHNYKDIFLLILHTGVRRGEACAIKWSDLHLDETNPWVTIERSYSKTKTGFSITKPKTQDSIRAVGLTRELAKMLTERKQRMITTRFIQDTQAFENTFVFETLFGTPPRPDTITNQLTKALKDAGLEGVGPHQLRHLITTMLMAESDNIASISGHLGHSNIRTTIDIYGHQSRQATNNIGQLIQDVLTQPTNPS